MLAIKYYEKGTHKKEVNRKISLRKSQNTISKIPSHCLCIRMLYKSSSHRWLSFSLPGGRFMSRIKAMKIWFLRVDYGSLSFECIRWERGINRIRGKKEKEKWRDTMMKKGNGEKEMTVKSWLLFCFCIFVPLFFFPSTCFLPSSFTLSFKRHRSHSSRKTEPLIYMQRGAKLQS